MQRQERRRPAKLDADMVDRGINPGQADLAFIAALTRQTYRELGLG